MLLSPIPQQMALALIRAVSFESLRRLIHHCFNVGDKSPLKTELEFLSTMLTQLGTGQTSILFNLNYLCVSRNEKISVRLDTIIYLSIYLSFAFKNLFDDL